MRTNPQTRKRYPVGSFGTLSGGDILGPQGSVPPFGVRVTDKPGFTPPPTQVGGLLRILQGVFGLGAPLSRSSDPAQVVNQKPGPLYHMHEGDIFEPGTGNWVLDPAFDGPLMTVWGNGDSYPNVMHVTDTPVAIALPTYLTNGLGGPVAGQIALQPLVEESFNG